MNAVEGAGEDKSGVAVDRLQTRGEGAGVDKAASFVDYEEGEYDPGGVRFSGVGEMGERKRERERGGEGRGGERYIMLRYGLHIGQWEADVVAICWSMSLWRREKDYLLSDLLVAGPPSPGSTHDASAGTEL